MFNKKSCKECNKKISGKFDFCPHCGASINYKSEEDWGMLGKNDKINEQDIFSKSMFGGMNGKILNKMLGGAMKMLERELQKEMKTQNQIGTNFELYINGKKINPENIKITKGQIKENTSKKRAIITTFSEQNQKKFAELPKNEPPTNIRRLSDKVIYELEVPGVESLGDVSIAKLETSIEIKAIAKDKAYKKLIRIDLPLKGYKLDNQKLILELGVKTE